MTTTLTTKNFANLAIISAAFFAYHWQAEAQDSGPLVCAAFVQPNRLLEFAKIFYALPANQQPAYLDAHVRIKFDDLAHSTGDERSSKALQHPNKIFDKHFGVSELRSAVGFILSSLVRPREADSMWFRFMSDPVEQLDSSTFRKGMVADLFSIRVGATGFPFQLPIMQWIELKSGGQYRAWLRNIVMRIDRRGDDLIIRGVKPVFYYRYYSHGTIQIAEPIQDPENPGKDEP